MSRLLEAISNMDKDYGIVKAPHDPNDNNNQESNYGGVVANPVQAEQVVTQKIKVVPLPLREDPKFLLYVKPALEFMKAYVELGGQLPPREALINMLQGDELQNIMLQALINMKVLTTITYEETELEEPFLALINIAGTEVELKYKAERWIDILWKIMNFPMDIVSLTLEGAGLKNAREPLDLKVPYEVAVTKVLTNVKKLYLHDCGMDFGMLCDLLEYSVGFTELTVIRGTCPAFLSLPVKRVPLRYVTLYHCKVRADILNLNLYETLWAIRIIHVDVYEPTGNMLCKMGFPESFCLQAIFLDKDIFRLRELQELTIEGLHVLAKNDIFKALPVKKLVIKVPLFVQVPESELFNIGAHHGVFDTNDLELLSLMKRLE